jgi:hypothetical protein
LWAGPILLPNTPSVLKRIAEGIVSMDAQPRDPKVAMFLYMMRKEVIIALGGRDAMVVVHAFDANGEEHGRERFKWALEMEGVMDMTEIKNLKGVADMQGQSYHFPPTYFYFFSSSARSKTTRSADIFFPPTRPAR